jgi:hypothetical protein
MFLTTLYLYSPLKYLTTIVNTSTYTKNLNSNLDIKYSSSFISYSNLMSTSRSAFADTSNT